MEKGNLKQKESHKSTACWLDRSGRQPAGQPTSDTEQREVKKTLTAKNVYAKVRNVYDILSSAKRRERNIHDPQSLVSNKASVTQYNQV